VVAVMLYNSNVAFYQRELDQAREYVKHQCSDGHEVLRWQRGRVCAEKHELVDGPSPQNRALTAFARSFTVCDGFEDCRERYGWLFQGFYALLSKALVAVVIVAALMLLGGVWTGNHIRSTSDARMTLPVHTCKAE